MSHPAAAFMATLANPVVDRRGFLTFTAKGLVLGCVLPVAGRIGAASAATSNHDLATAYIRVGTDNSITLAFGGAEDMLLGPAKNFQDRMKVLAESIPNNNGKLLLIPGLGHVPHLEAPDKVLPPLVAFLKEGTTAGTQPQ